MPNQALTSEFLASLPDHVPVSGATNFFDSDIRGFLLELRSSGGATYYFRYRNAAGKVRMNNLGRVGVVALADARDKAHKMRTLLREGGDPGLEMHRFREAPTLADFVAQRYLPYVKVHKRSWDMDESLLRNHLLPVLGDRRMNRIVRSEVMAFHHGQLGKGYAPGTCNRMLILLRCVYNCAIRWEVLPPASNPCDGVKELEDNGARERYLSAEEVQRLFAELDRNRNVQVGQVIRLLLYTGARKREILDAKWDEIDFARRILTVPAARSKSRKTHHIALSDVAVELLQSLPRHEGVPWVFVSPKTGRPPVSIFNAWNSIRKRAGMPELRLHDLRHSYASFLVNAGRSLYEVQRLLGHQDPKMTMRYAHLAPQAMLEAANVVGAVVAGARCKFADQSAPTSEVGAGQAGAPPADMPESGVSHPPSRVSRDCT